MSVDVQDLVEKLTSAFGPSFGTVSTAIGSISEAVEREVIGERKKEDLKSKGKKRKTPPGDRKYRDVLASLRKDVDASNKEPEKKKEEPAAAKRPGNLQGALKLLKQIMHTPSSSGGGGAGAAAEAPIAQRHQGSPRGGNKGSAAGGGGAGAHTSHTPFRKSSNLGKGPGTPPGFKKVRGSVYHDQVKCWRCSCGDVYKDGCRCTGTGATADCPAGHVKHVVIKHGYRQAYNKMYHKWRGQQGGAVTARVAKGGRA